MQFDNSGNLVPYIIIESNLSDFEMFFVNQFSHSKTRQKLFVEYLTHFNF